MNYSTEIYRFISPGAILSLIFIYIHYNRKGPFLLFPKRIVLKAPKFLIQGFLSHRPPFICVMWYLSSSHSPPPQDEMKHMIKIGLPLIQKPHFCRQDKINTYMKTYHMLNISQTVPLPPISKQHCCHSPPPLIPPQSPHSRPHCCKCDVQSNHVTYM